MYATSANYQIIIDRFIEIIIMTINKYGLFQLHINLSSFTITSFERYQNVFQLYYKSCINRGLLYDSKIVDKITIYNTPSIITSVSMMIVKYTEPSIKQKLVYYSKEVSKHHLDILLKTI